MKHVNDGRGTHTTVIEPAQKLLKESKRIQGVEGISNGPIERGIGAKRRAYKIIVTDSSHIRLDVVTPQSKQTFTVFTLKGQATPVAKRLDHVWRGF